MNYSEREINRINEIQAELKEELIQFYKGISNHYVPQEVADIAMIILNDYSGVFPKQTRSDLISLVTMDMGEEFEIPKDEVLEMLNRMIGSLEH